MGGEGGPVDRAFGIDIVGMTKRFGPLVALDHVTVKISGGRVYALLGENGAGKSTLVKCVIGYYQADAGDVFLAGERRRMASPREAHAVGIGMVYQHFTLVPNMTVAENLVMARADVPFRINWRRERERIDGFLRNTPFAVPLDLPVADLAAGEKQKVEIVKQLYLQRHFLILDEPTSVLTPGEADQVLGMLREMASNGDITVLMITHKLREVSAFADRVAVLRSGRLVGGGEVSALNAQDMAAMMIGSKTLPKPADRQTSAPVPSSSSRGLEIRGLMADDAAGTKALRGIDLNVSAGEIVGVAGVSGNGQRELVETLAGQRLASEGEILIHGEVYRATRREMTAKGVFCLPEEPLRNACVPAMTVAENLSLRTFDRRPLAWRGWWLRKRAIRRMARQQISHYNIKPPVPETPIASLSGGNVQRVVLAREFAPDVTVLVVANPCFGLDIVAVAEVRRAIVETRNRGVAVLLVSEDLDEILELSDRVVVMFNGNLVHETPIELANVAVIGRRMAGHHDEG